MIRLWEYCTVNANKENTVKAGCLVFGLDQIVILNVLMKEAAAEAVAMTLVDLSTHRFQPSGEGILVLGKCFQWLQLRFGRHI